MQKMDFRIADISQKPQLKYMLPVGTLGFSNSNSKAQRTQVNWTLVLLGIVIFLGVLLVQLKSKAPENRYIPAEGAKTCTNC